MDDHQRAPGCGPLRGLCGPDAFDGEGSPCLWFGRVAELPVACAGRDWCVLDGLRSESTDDTLADLYLSIDDVAEF